MISTAVIHDANAIPDTFVISVNLAIPETKLNVPPYAVKRYAMKIRPMICKAWSAKKSFCSRYIVTDSLFFI